MQHLRVGLLHHEAALARIHRLVREGLLSGARAHAEERAVEDDRQLLERILVAVGEVGLERGEPGGQAGVVGGQRGLPRQRLGERGVDLGLVAARQQRVHAVAVLAEVDKVLSELSRHGFDHDYPPWVLMSDLVGRPSHLNAAGGGCSVQARGKVDEGDAPHQAARPQPYQW